MNLPNAQPEPINEGNPPVFKSWKQLYIFVLVLHAIIVLLFYLFKISFS